MNSQLLIEGTDVTRLTVRKDWQPMGEVAPLRAGWLLVVKQVDLMQGNDHEITYHIYNSGRLIGDVVVYGTDVIDALSNLSIGIEGSETLNETLKRIYTKRVRFIEFEKQYLHENDPQSDYLAVVNIMEVDRADYVTDKGRVLSAKGERLLAHYMPSHKDKRHHLEVEPVPDDIDEDWRYK